MKKKQKKLKKIRGFELVTDSLRVHPNNEYVKLPQRGTEHSAGYDITSPIDVILKPGEHQIVWTDVKGYMQNGEVLMLFMRSSVAIKQNIVVKNTVGIIDADYYSNPKNDGNIGMCLLNTGKEDVQIKAGDKIGQLIFIPYLISDNCNTETKRTGGVGSTGK